MDQTNKEFWDAAAAGDFAKVCACVSKGANVNVSNGDGRTALMRSASAVTKISFDSCWITGRTSGPRRQQ